MPILFLLATVTLIIPILTSIPNSFFLPPNPASLSFNPTPTGNDYHPALTPTPQITTAPTPTPTQTPIPTLSLESKLPDNSSGPTQQAYVTFYGWPDNDPPGNAIAYPRHRYPESLHDSAGGTGTYANPITFASPQSQFAIGTIVYLPYIQKYAIKEDFCASCQQNRTHIDLWMNSDAAHEAQLYACQNHWTRSTTAIEVNPPPSRPVSTTPLFNASNGDCQ